jgi:hypothetical protein
MGRRRVPSASRPSRTRSCVPSRWCWKPSSSAARRRFRQELGGP